RYTGIRALARGRGLSIPANRHYGFAPYRLLPTTVARSAPVPWNHEKCCRGQLWPAHGGVATHVGVKNHRCVAANLHLLGQKLLGPFATHRGSLTQALASAG